MKKVHIVPHTHWDREWYFNIEDSNLLLCENMTHLIKYMENNSEYPSFIFDAQASIIDEYLKIYPENREKLKELIKNRRIFVGPWYTQTDSLLVNKESVIRNLQYGIDICESFGHSMNVGYLPDIFGQNQYLPSIFKNFDIEYAILQRGIYTEELKENLNFNWISPDGLEIKTNNIYCGYGPGKFLDSSDIYINKSLLPILKRLENLNKDSNDILLPAGGDQVLIREYFIEVVKKLNEKNIGYEFLLSDYERFMKNAWEINYQNKIYGELRGCEKSRIHRTIGSQRYDIKRANSIIENKILNSLEPLSVIAMNLGLEYPEKWLDISWKLLFDVHSHDSIGGCNSDSTNSEIINRINKIEKIVDGLINIIKKKITIGISNKLNKKKILVIFNTDAKESIKDTNIILFTTTKYPIVKTIDEKIVETTIISSEYISGGKKVVVTAKGEVQQEIKGYYKTELLLNGLTIPTLGYNTYIIEEKSKKNCELEKTEKLDSGYDNNNLEIQNSYYNISLKDKKLTINNKFTGNIIENFLSFESCADSGDSYDFSPIENDNIQYFNNFKLVTIIKKKNIEEIKLISVLDKFRNLIINTTIVLMQNSKNISIKLSVDNSEENHRLRAIIDSDLKQFDYSYSDSGFSLAKHPVKEARMKNWKEGKYVEAPVPIYNLENLVLLEDDKNSLQFFSQGIKEYEVLNSRLAITLFRAVGVLGNDNLLWRPGRASGINNKVIHTPDAQMKQNLIFEYGIIFEPKCSINKIYQNMENYIKKYVPYQLQQLNTYEERLERFEIPIPIEKFPSTLSILDIGNKNLFTTVLKKSFKDESIIVRVFNPSDQEEIIKFKFSVVEVNLKEQNILEGMRFTIKPKSYKTFKIN